MQLAELKRWLELKAWSVYVLGGKKGASHDLHLSAEVGIERIFSSVQGANRSSNLVSRVFSQMRWFHWAQRHHSYCKSLIISW